MESLTYSGIVTGMTTSPEALIVKADIWSTPLFKLTGFYSDVDFGYDVYYSSLNPYYEMLVPGAVTPGPVPAPGLHIPFERWMRNDPVLFSHETWGGELGFNLGSFEANFCYYDLKLNLPSTSINAPWDGLYALTLTKVLSPTVSLSASYAREIGAYGFVPDLEMIQTQAVVGF